jgi:prepilin signal peptidase PulO-like enzyme (type II secretory pathway)
VAVVFGITALPGLADGLTWLALIACPPLAAVALGWAMRGARPVYAVAAVPLLAAAWMWSDELGGHLAALALTALSCVTLARLLAGVAPRLLLKLGILAMAAADAWLILSDQLQQPNSTLVSAAPPAQLPRLQVAIVDPASMGFGDLFLAAVLGAVVASEASRRTQLGMAALMLVLAVAFDALFLVLDELPATVPVAAALLVYEAIRRARRARARWPAPGAAPG